MKVIKENIFNIIIISVFLFFAATAFATGGDDHGCPPGHEHRDSCNGDNQGPPGEDGKDGIDGQDGTNGTDGVDGKDGRDGVDGTNGIDGLDGEVDYTRVNSTINTTINRETGRWKHFLAAQSSLQIHLPQDSSQRLTLAGSTIEGTSGVGLGYAYKFDRDDNLSITAGIGTSGGENIGVLSVGFEFGNNRHALQEFDSYNDSQLRSRLDSLEHEFRRQKELWNEDAKRCAADLERASEINDRIEERFMECLRK